MRLLPPSGDENTRLLGRPDRGIESIRKRDGFHNSRRQGERVGQFNEGDIVIIAFIRPVGRVNDEVFRPVLVRSR